MDFNSDDLLELKKYLDANNISKEQVCIVGSATLSLIGIREHNDIDIVLHSDFDGQLSQHSFIERVNKPWSKLFSDDELVENPEFHMIFKGFKFVIPELIYHRKSWHNRLKDAQDILELNEYAKMHNDWKWGLINNYLPKKYFLKIVVNKVIKKLNSYNNKLRDYFRINNTIHSDCFQVIPTNLLLSKQFVNNQFNRFDIIVRYNAIHSYLNNDNVGVDLYKRMQEQRGGSPYTSPWKNFKVLIDNYKSVGYSTDSPILVNNELHIVDGAHRLACALYFKSPSVSVKINSKLSYSLYSLDWFTKSEITTEEILFLSEKKQDLFNENYLYFEVILWPSVSQYFDDISTDINNQYKIFESKSFIKIKNLDSFIKELYKIDDIKDWKVDMKIKELSSYKKELRVLKIEIPEPDFRKKTNGKLISQKVEQLKKEVRNKYSSKINNYFHDIIIHIGDNYDHSKQSSKLEIEV
jgi:hypothetical protein